jgi:hypothetical protein
MTDQILGRTTVDLSHMSREDLQLFRRHLLGVLAMIDRLLGLHKKDLTSFQK